MTTISNMNIVVQQTGTSKEAHDAKHQLVDANQMATDKKQEEKRKEQAITVQDSENSEKIKIDSQNSQKHKKKKKPNKDKKKMKKKNTKPTGKLIDTIV